MKKAKMSGIIVLAVLLIVVNVIFFMLPVEHTVTFWLADVFAIIAVVIQLLVHYIAYSKSETLTSKVFGFPVAQVGYIYLLSQLIISIIAVALSQWIPVWLMVLIGVLLLGTALIGLIAAHNARTVIEDMEENHQGQISLMKSLTANIKILYETTDNVSLKPELQKLYENFRYSDPVSSAELADVENDMQSQLKHLSLNIKENNTDGAIETIKILNNKLTERNYLCKMSKKRSTDKGTI